jgi:hypothetical protein
VAEAAARAAWQARLQAGREARAREAGSAPVVDAPAATLASRHPEVRRAEVLSSAAPGDSDVPAVDAVDVEPEPVAPLAPEPEVAVAFTPLTVEIDLEDPEPEPDEPEVVHTARRTDHGIRPEVLEAAATAEPEAARRRSAHGLSRHALVQVAIAGLLIAGVIVGGPRVGDVVAWGHGLFASDQPTTVGTAVTLEATTYHPAGTALAGAPVPVQVESGPGAAKGEHLVAVPLRIRNDGSAKWDVPVGAEAALVDALGVSHPVARAVKAVKGFPLLPAVAKVGPGAEVSGYVVFSVPNGRDLRSVSLGLAKAGDDTVSWQVSP